MSDNFLLLRWLVANLVGFVAGSLLGATDGGLFVQLIPGRPGVVVGDLVFGSAIGFAQRLAFHHTPARSLPATWILATAIGFTLGARMGGRFAPDVAALTQLPISTVFGVCMGTSLGLATLPLLGTVNLRRSTIWVGSNAVAWILGEGIAFSTSFAQAAVSAVALVIAGTTWVGLAFARPIRPHS